MIIMNCKMKFDLTWKLGVKNWVIQNEYPFLFDCAWAYSLYTGVIISFPSRPFKIFCAARRAMPLSVFNVAVPKCGTITVIMKNLFQIFSY